MSNPFIAERRTANHATVPRGDDAAFSARELDAYGPLAPFVADERVTDVFVNGSAGLFVDRGSGPERVEEWRASEREVHDLATDLVGYGGRHVDDSAPLVDVRMPGGARVHVALSPIATSGLSSRPPSSNSARGHSRPSASTTRTSMNSGGSPSALRGESGVRLMTTPPSDDP